MFLYVSDRVQRNILLSTVYLDESLFSLQMYCYMFINNI